MRRLITGSVVLGLLAGCGTGAGGDFDMSVRRVALSLAFSDEDKAEPIAPRVIVRLIPAPPAALAPDADLSNLPDPFNAFDCATAPESAPVVDVAAYEITAPPAAGVYRRHNSGSVTLRGAIPIKLPFPRQTRWELGDVHEVPAPPPTEDPTAPGGGAENVGDNFPPGEYAGKPMWEYTVRKVLTPQFTVVDTYRLTSRRVLLLKRETITVDGSTIFTPDPPITMVEHADGEGHTWRSAGIDQATGQAMYVDARVEKREPVDLCGTLRDTYRVVVQERMVNLATGETSGTADDDPNVYNVATQLGGLVLREDLHFTQTVTTPEGAGIIEWDYVSTQDAAEPEPAP